MKSLPKQTRGQGLIEFALVLPLLLVLMLGIMEFSRAWMTQNIMTGAAREAARMYAVRDDTIAADARADQVLSSGGLDLSRRTLTRSNSGGAVSYRIDYQFPVSVPGFVPGLGDPIFPLSSTTTMRREWGT